MTKIMKTTSVIETIEFKTSGMDPMKKLIEVKKLKAKALALILAHAKLPKCEGEDDEVLEKAAEKELEELLEIIEIFEKKVGTITFEDAIFDADFALLHETDVDVEDAIDAVVGAVDLLLKKEV